MERLLKSRVLKRISIITAANYFSKAMGLLFFMVLIWLGGKELISRFYPVYLIHVFIVTINFYGFGILILKKSTLNTCNSLDYLRGAYGLFSGLFICSILLWNIVVRPEIQLTIAMLLMLLTLWIYERINILRCNLFNLNSDWKVVISQTIDSTLRVIISFVILIIHTDSTPVLVLLSLGTLLSAVVSFLYLSKDSILDSKIINTDYNTILSSKNWGEMLSALGIGFTVLLIPVIGWLDDFLYRMFFGMEVVIETVGTLSVMYTFMNSFIVIIISFIIVASTEKKFKTPTKKNIGLSFIFSFIVYITWSIIKLPEYNYAGTILLIPFVVLIILKTYEKINRQENYVVLLGGLILLVVKCFTFYLLRNIPSISNLNVSIYSSFAGLILMAMYFTKSEVVLMVSGLKTLLIKAYS